LRGLVFDVSGVNLSQSSFFLKSTSMNYHSALKLASKWLLVASLLGFGFAMAQAEPTLNQVYAAAQSGKLDQAQLMIQQVLIAHPTSAKAFFVQSELYARQGDMARAREALATAEKLAPGLPFAKAESVQTLRAQLSAKKAPATAAGLNTHSAAPMAVTTAAPSAPASSAASWALPLLLAGGVIGLGYFLFRKKKPDPYAQQPGFASPGGLGGPQTFGSAAGASPYSQPAYANQGGMNGPQSFGMGGGAMQQPYGQPAGSGLGGRIMGGVATGLAVGAGMMAVDAIGKNLMGGHTPATPAPAADSFANNDYQALQNNPDMGGQNFGVNDASSWDDGGSMDVGGGGDWDN
jgi:hypothetical protein